MKAPGCFIVIEGIDGSGSTTQADLLASELRRRGRRVTQTREPTSGPIGALIRQVLTHRLGVTGAEGRWRAPAWTTMALLFAADRCDHGDVLIRPRLEQGEIVISDRYLLSSLAYQSLTADEPDALEWIRGINQQALQPDLTIVLDIDAELAAERRSSRGGAPELYELDELQRRLAAFYARGHELLPGRVLHVDASGTPNRVHEAILQAFEKTMDGS